MIKEESEIEYEADDFEGSLIPVGTVGMTLKIYQRKGLTKGLIWTEDEKDDLKWDYVAGDH